MTYIILFIITLVLLLAGLASTFLIVFPSVSLMFIIVFIYGLIDHFKHLTTAQILILAGIALLAELIDYVSGFYGAKIGGARFKSLLIGMAGLIVGLIIYPPFGGIFGLFLGIVLGEILFSKDLFRAFKAGFGSLVGSLVGAIIKITLAIIFFVLYLVFVF